YDSASYYECDYYNFDDDTKNNGILITELYIKITLNNETVNIDLYDYISINKEDIKIYKKKDYIQLILKKQEKKLWGYLYLFSLFVNYKNYYFPNLLKCTKSEKNEIVAQEKKFKELINQRRLKSINNFKKILKKDKNNNEQFLKHLENDAQQIQSKLDQEKIKEIEAQKESVKKKVIDSIYEQSDGKGEFNNPKEPNELNKNLLKKKNKLLLEESNNNQNKIIKLNFTQLKTNEVPARESRNLKKTLTNYSSTKVFFLLVLIEKAKKSFFKNSDFYSCLETLKSVTSYVESGNQLNTQEHIKVLCNLSLIYLLTNNINNCIEQCDKCINLIKGEIKNHNIDHEEPEHITIQNKKFFDILNSLDNIKNQNYVQYLFIIYAVVIVRK
ncbi:conserved protein, unknown function, partial [Hepatocystis sp. ex Piliocolobus tephrosceles]